MRARTALTVLPLALAGSLGAASAMPSTAPTRADQTPPSQLVLALSDDGLNVFQEGAQAPQRLAFGQPAKAVNRSVVGAIGARLRTATDPDCNNVTVTYYRRGLSVWSNKGRFVGWDLNGTKRQLTTEGGVGIGSRAAAVRTEFPGAKFTRSALGREFTTGNLHGTFARRGTLDRLWAGQICTFR
jgi:hypothetical protein